MPEWFQCEGIDAGARPRAAHRRHGDRDEPYVLEIAPDGEGAPRAAARRRGRQGAAARPAAVRPHASCGCARRPRSCTTPRVTRGCATSRRRRRRSRTRTYRLLDRMIVAAARARHRRLPAGDGREPAGLSRAVLGRASPRTSASGPDCAPHEARVDRNASSRARDVVRVRRDAARPSSPSAIRTSPAFRLDWPEYPPYDLESALFDFNPCGAGADGGRRPRSGERSRTRMRAWLACDASRGARAAPRPTARASRDGARRRWIGTRSFSGEGALGALVRREAARGAARCSRGARRARRGARPATATRAAGVSRRRSTAISGFPLDDARRASPTPSASSSTRCTGR